MTSPDLTAAKGFLDFHADAPLDVFATAFVLEIQKTNGLYTLPNDDASGTWSCAFADVCLYGITAIGGNAEEAIRNWRRVATKLTQTDAPHGILAWALEALTDPAMLADDAICHRACRAILNHSGQSADHARANAVLSTLPTPESRPA